ncbi:MAG TPA: hypothetical protein VFI25_03930 [Planctomycetota bacterium]|jgi:hypothetical protein|nr:hypothetical protein [Planctomycetota bacterium]
MKPTRLLLSALLASAPAAAPAAAPLASRLAFTITGVGQPCCAVCSGAVAHKLECSVTPQVGSHWVRFAITALGGDLNLHFLVLGKDGSGILPVLGPSGTCAIFSTPDLVLATAAAAPMAVGADRPRVWLQEFQVPDDPALAGLAFNAQGIHLEAAGFPVGAVTNGLRIEID